MKRKDPIYRVIENVSIIGMMLLAVAMLLFSFMHFKGVELAFDETFMMGRMAERMFSAVLLIIGYNLYQRKRLAWVLTIFLLVCNIVFHLFLAKNAVIQVFLIIEVIILAILLWRHKSFFKTSDKNSVKIGAIIGAVVVVLTLLNAGLVHFLYAKFAHDNVPSFLQCVTAGIGNMFGQSSNLFATESGKLQLFEVFVMVFSWICILVALVFILRPFLNRNKTTKEDIVHARKLVNQYGQNPGAYLTLEEDKTLFFGKQVDGVVAYGVVGETVVINGDPICAPENFKVLLEEFSEFCRNSSYNMFFLSTTNKYIDVYEAMDFEVVKCGEESRFELDTYDIAGKKGAKMRANINKATREGLSVKEYEVRKARDPKIEQEIDRISSEWLSGKSSSQLGFTLGTVGLEDPMDKRYFYACDEQGIIQGFIVFCPFETGYMADVTRRSNEAPSGIMQKIMFEAFQVFKEEGVKEGSMGLAPLVNLIEEGKEANAPEKLLNFIYEHMNSIYEFKNLYRAKEAYSPSRWEPGYFVYSPKMLTPQMVYAVVAIQNPQGMMDYVKAFFRGKAPVKKD